MRFQYCPHCGTAVSQKQIGDEGLIPYCDPCKIPLWDMFTTCVICAVVNEQNEIDYLDRLRIYKQLCLCRWSNEARRIG